MTPEHVQGWRDFLATVEVRGPLPIVFEIVQDPRVGWVLRSTMLIPDRTGAPTCAGCGRQLLDLPVIIQNTLPAPDESRELVIRQRVLGHFQHEALESILIGGRRAFDPHNEHWYSNLVADWRFNR